MLEIIFYYVWLIFFILVLGLLIIVLILLILIWLDKINKKIQTLSIFYYKMSKMNWQEKQIISDLYRSLMENQKEELKNKYFNE